MNWTKANVALLIIVLVAVVSLGLVVWSTVTGHDVSPIVQTLLGVVLGFLGSNLSSAQGAEQALSTPPPSTVVTTHSPITPSTPSPTA